MSLAMELNSPMVYSLLSFQTWRKIVIPSVAKHVGGARLQ